MKRHHKELGRRLREAREKVDISQVELAEAIGCHSSQVSRWERGHYAPTIYHLVSIARATGASLDWLMTMAKK